MATASGRHILNGRDLFDVYGIIVQAGAAAFLTPHKRKQPFSVAFSEENSAEYNLDSVTFEDAQIPVTMTFYGPNDNELFARKDAFFAEIRKPGWQTWQVTDNRETYQVFYNDVQAMDKVTKELNGAGVKFLRCTLLVTKKAPDVGTVVQTLGLVTSHTDVTTNGGNNGSITAQGFGGSGSFQYQLNTGAWSSAKAGPHTFTNLVQGVKSVKVRDAANISNETLPRLVFISEPALPAALSLRVSKIDVSTTGGTNGQLFATASGGVTPYQYKLNNDVYVNVSTFNGLAAGFYTVWVKDTAGTERSVTVEIVAPGQVLIKPGAPTLPVTNDTDNLFDWTNNPLYPNASDMEFTQNGATTVTNLPGKPALIGEVPRAAGQVGVRVKAAPGRMPSDWLFNVVPFTVASAALMVSAVPTNATTNGGTNGYITVTASGGVSPYTYSLNGAPFQSSNVFSNLAAGNYNVAVRDSIGNIANTSTTVSQPAVQTPTLTLSLSKTDATTNGGSNGSITASAGGGTGGYTYRLGSGAFQASATFTGLTAGSYTVTVRDSAGTETSASINVGQPAATNNVTAYYGWKADSSVLTAAQIQAGTALSVASGADITADYRANTQPQYLWMAEPSTEPIKTKWFGSVSNNGNIGGEEDLFGPSVIVAGGWRFYITAYQTQNTQATIQFRKA